MTNLTVLFTVFFTSLISFAGGGGGSMMDAKVVDGSVCKGPELTLFIDKKNPQPDPNWIDREWIVRRSDRADAQSKEVLATEVAQIFYDRETRTLVVQSTTSSGGYLSWMIEEQGYKTGIYDQYSGENKLKGTVRCPGISHDHL